MLRLPELPSDLLSSVFEFLSKREFQSLARTCHALNTKATPFLYRNIKFTASKSRSCARKLALLLRTLLERPGLAPEITHFGLFGPQQCWEKYDPWPGNDESSIKINLWGFDKSTKTLPLLTPNMFYHLVDDDMQISQEELKGRSKDTIATLIMARLMNLNTLELGDGFLRHSIFLPQMLKRIDYLFPDMARVILGDRYLDREAVVSYTDLNLIRPIFYSSTVTSFEWSMMEPWKFRWGEAEAPFNQNLTSLRLFRTNITRKTLFQLLDATPHLKSFSYEQEITFNGSTPGAPSLSPYLELEGLNSALGCVRRTLESCQLILRLAPGSISASQYPSCGIAFPAIEGTLTILKDMPRLKQVEVPMVMFFGWFPRTMAKLDELLPRKITDLTLRDDLVPYCYWSRPSSRGRRIARIGTYLKDRAVHAPYLNTLKVRLINAKEQLRESVQELSLSAFENGITTRVLRGAKSETYYWRLEGKRIEPRRPELGTRVDSVLREDGPLHAEVHFLKHL
ncbi:hypothetical protein IQ07DRAFT_167019 [Pyrenochaeta sp. DS3sAY3a]|nr:hypothetical protein IQ07DRAFT_167019 [Pyrenochaeta sp. DS3sAY3a]